MGLLGLIAKARSMSYTPTAYPHRLYMGGLVIPGDLHATNSVVVEDAEAEEAAREKGYRKAYEPAPEVSGNGGSSTLPALPGDQGGAAPASAGPVHDEPPEFVDAEPDADGDGIPDADDPDALRAEAVRLGLKPHHKAGVAKLREMIAAAPSPTRPPALPASAACAAPSPLSISGKSVPMATATARCALTATSP